MSGKLIAGIIALIAAGIAIVMKVFKWITGGSSSSGGGGGGGGGGISGAKVEETIKQTKVVNEKQKDATDAVKKATNIDASTPKKQKLLSGKQHNRLLLRKQQQQKNL